MLAGGLDQFVYGLTLNEIACKIKSQETSVSSHSNYDAQVPELLSIRYLVPT